MAVFISDLEDSAVVRWDPASKRVEQVIADKRLLWPDTLSWGANGEMYVTASQIENMPRFNNGKSTRSEPYKLWKVIGPLTIGNITEVNDAFSENLIVDHPRGRLGGRAASFSTPTSR
jgi:hypothetical protein